MPELANTSDAVVNNDGGSWGLDIDNDSFELSVWRRFNVCSEVVWDCTSGENIGLSNIPRLCWTDDAEDKEKFKKKIFIYFFDIRLNVTLGNDDVNCIDGDICWDDDGGEFLIDKGLLSIRLYGFILQSVWTPCTSNLCF